MPPDLLNGLYLSKVCGNLVREPRPDEENWLFITYFNRNSFFDDYYHLTYSIVNSQFILKIGKIYTFSARRNIGRQEGRTS